MKQYSKKYGQVFLADPNIRGIELKILNPQPDDEIVEIGPGGGFLTEKILETKARVICIESDHRFADYLRAKFFEYVQNGKLEIIHDNFLEYNMERCSKIIGNIPYHISSPILEKLTSIRFEECVLMVQEEFARRMVATHNSSSYSRLSVFTYAHFDATIQKIVSRNCFHPKPDVDSAIVKLLPTNRLRGIPNEYFDDTLKTLFSNRRKKIENSIEGTPHGDLRIDQLDQGKILDIIEFTYRNLRAGSD